MEKEEENEECACGCWAEINARFISSSQSFREVEEVEEEDINEIPTVFYFFQLETT